MSLQTDLARVRGLGSAKEGTGHWWAQRLTAVALVPLGIWFVFAAVSLAGANLGEFRAWLTAPYNLILMVLLVGVLFHHMQLGMQVVFEDYIHNERSKTVVLILNKFVAVILGVSCIIALLRVAFGG